ncbi:MAG TPA: hypothetical protein VHV10_18965, partial [Ktedonobacteraceae bacterium]|nr:hypothetical protein [Ktedonobacteraceae bacterium]
MNTTSLDKIRTSVVTRVAGPLILAVLAITFFTTPMVSFAGNSSGDPGSDKKPSPTAVPSVPDQRPVEGGPGDNQPPPIPTAKVV